MAPGLVGSVLGTAIGKLVVYLRIEHKEAVGLDEFRARFDRYLIRRCTACTRVASSQYSRPDSLCSGFGDNTIMPPSNPSTRLLPKKSSINSLRSACQRQGTTNCSRPRGGLRSRERSLIP